MKTTKVTVLICLCTLMALTTFCGSSDALTGNTRANSVPFVGIVVLFSDAARTIPVSYSTGILVSPTVVLTAGHSVVGGVAASVCFDQGPLAYTVDENGKMTYETNRPIYNGVPIPYPKYLDSIQAGAKPSQVLQTSDVGLIVLDNPVTEVAEFPSLPAPQLTDTLPVNTALKVAGYGVHEQLTPRGHQSYTWIGSLACNQATVRLLSNDFQGCNNYLKCSANAAQLKGGIAYGDSGGPVLYANNGQTVIIAVNAYVNNANCAGVTYHTRIDNPQVLDWIAQYQ